MAQTENTLLLFSKPFPTPNPSNMGTLSEFWGFGSKHELSPLQDRVYVWRGGDDGRVLTVVAFIQVLVRIEEMKNHIQFFHARYVSII